YEPPGLTQFGELDTAATEPAHPGTPPSSPDAGETRRNHAAGPPHVLIPLKLSNDGLAAPRFCRHCGRHKPPRTHHCRRCGRCVLRMDHHCPWVANCVGFRNQAHFARFLAWTTVTGWAAIGLLVARASSAFQALLHGDDPSRRRSLPGDGELVVVGLNLFLLVPVVSITSMLAFNQAMNLARLLGGLHWGGQFAGLLRNQTTIESVEKEDNPTAFFSPVDGSTTPPLLDPYDLGSALLNVASVLDPAWAVEVGNLSSTRPC
ncbi:hypothetical protein HK405_007687, partial [Cladochytrium tenue]